jgi:hypothetical protein
MSDQRRPESTSSASSKQGAGRRELSTLNRQIVLQFLIVLAPGTILNVYQVLVERANSRLIEHTAQVRSIADQARAHYAIFLDGVVDAVDAGQLSGKALEALAATLDDEQKLEAADAGHSADAVAAPITSMFAALQKDASLKARTMKNAARASERIMAIGTSHCWRGAVAVAMAARAASP